MAQKHVLNAKCNFKIVVSNSHVTQDILIELSKYHVYYEGREIEDNQTFGDHVNLLATEVQRSL